MLQAGLCLLNGTLLHVFPQPNWGGLSTQPRPLPAPTCCAFPKMAFSHHIHIPPAFPPPLGVQVCLAPFSVFSMFISKWQDSAIGLGVLCVLHDDKELKPKMCEFEFGQPELPPHRIRGLCVEGQARDEHRESTRW